MKTFDWRGKVTLVELVRLAMHSAKTLGASVVFMSPTWGDFQQALELARRYSWEDGLTPATVEQDRYEFEDGSYVHFVVGTFGGRGMCHATGAIIYAHDMTNPFVVEEAKLIPAAVDGHEPWLILA